MAKKEASVASSTKWHTPAKGSRKRKAFASRLALKHYDIIGRIAAMSENRELRRHYCIRLLNGFRRHLQRSPSETQVANMWFTLPVDMLVCFFVRVIVYLFVSSCVRLFVCLSVCLLVDSCVLLFVYLFLHLFICSLSSVIPSGIQADLPPAFPGYRCTHVVLSKLRRAIVSVQLPVGFFWSNSAGC